MMPVVAIAGLLSLAAFAILRVHAAPFVRGRRALVYFAIAGAFLVGVYVVRRGDVTVPLPLLMAVLTWLVATVVVVFVGIPLTVAKGILEIARRLRRPPSVERAVVNPGRRQLLAAVLPAAALATGAKGSVGGLAELKVTRLDVDIPNLPAALDGFKIGHITDTHIGPFLQPDDLRAAVKLLDDERVHLQVMTGDLLDDVSVADDCITALASTSAQHGQLCILGNHEKWRGERAVLDAYARAPANLKLLVDADTVIEHNGARLRVVGVDWPSKGTKRRLPAHERAEAMDNSARVAFANVTDGDVVVCLSHHPDFFPRAAERGASLTLAGHTHGGQVALFGVPAFGFAFEHMLGRYRRPHAHGDGDAHLFVGAGTGHWLPWRLGVPAEVAVITLRRRA